MLSESKGGGWQIKMETEEPDAIPFEAMLKRLPLRSAQECKIAWDWFDEREPADMMDTINKFTALGWNSAQIWNHVAKFFPPSIQQMSTVGKEFLALCVEHAVRGFVQSNCPPHLSPP